MLGVSVVKLPGKTFTTELTQRTTKDFFRQTPSDGFPVGLLVRRFERWVARNRLCSYLNVKL